MQPGNVHELHTGRLSDPEEPRNLPKVTRMEGEKARIQTQLQKKACMLCICPLGRGTHHTGPCSAPISEVTAVAIVGFLPVEKVNDFRTFKQ